MKEYLRVSWGSKFGKRTSLTQSLLKIKEEELKEWIENVTNFDEIKKALETSSTTLVTLVHDIDCYQPALKCDRTSSSDVIYLLLHCSPSYATNSQQSLICSSEPHSFAYASALCQQALQQALHEPVN